MNEANKKVGTSTAGTSLIRRLFLLTATGAKWSINYFCLWLAAMKFRLQTHFFWEKYLTIYRIYWQNFFSWQTQISPSFSKFESCTFLTVRVAAFSTCFVRRRADKFRSFAYESSPYANEDQCLSCGQRNFNGKRSTFLYSGAFLSGSSRTRTQKMFKIKTQAFVNGMCAVHFWNSVFFLWRLSSRWNIGEESDDVRESVRHLSPMENWYTKMLPAACGESCSFLIWFCMWLHSSTSCQTETWVVFQVMQLERLLNSSWIQTYHYHS